MSLARRFRGLLHLHTHMQLKAIIPNKATCTALCGKVDGQDNGFATFAHWQNDSSFFFAYRLSRPLNGIETFLAPGVLHFHLGVSLTKFTGGFDVGKKSMNDHLHRLTMQGKPTLRSLLQLIAIRPLLVYFASLFMHLHTDVPHLCCFHL